MSLAAAGNQLRHQSNVLSWRDLKNNLEDGRQKRNEKKLSYKLNDLLFPLGGESFSILM